jgi:flagellar basal-body rod protein FlgB
MNPLDKSMQFQETALQLREQRQQILASNLANADTPGFKARDFNFSQALQGALSQANASSTIGASQSAADLGGAPLLYQVPAQDSVDGNTVDVDVERNQFTDNALHYEASMTLITNQIKTMLAAITG